MKEQSPYKTARQTPDIDPRELRIGNYVNICDEVVKLSGVIKGGVYFEEHGYCANFANFIQPVPLTEEILIKAGFKQTGILFELDDFAVKKWVVGSDIEWVIFWGNNLIKYSKKYSVHRLQNLLYEISGRELEIKL